MKTISRLGALLALSAGVCFGQQPSSPTSTAGRFNVSQYANWSVRATNSVSSGSWTMFVNPCYPKFGTNVQQLFPLATNAPLTISDGSNSETVTPTTVLSDDGSGRCYFQAVFSRTHYQGVSVTSATAGLQEAINDAHKHGGGIVVVDSSWSGQTSMITTTGLGFANVVVEDSRALSGTIDQYKWNGSNYVLVSASGGGSGTVTHTLGSLTVNAIALGNSNDDLKVVPGITSDGTSKITLGVAGSSVGATAYNNATSGSVTVQPVTGALGSRTINVPAADGTFAVSGTSPVTLSAAGAIGCATCATTTNGGALSGTAPVAVSVGGAISITGVAGQVLAGSSPAFTATPTLGVQNSSQGTVTLAGSGASPGQLILNIAGASANALTIQPGANAGGVTLTGPTTGGTIPSTATSPVTLSAAGAIACATCVTSSSPGAGIARFAGSTQAVTSIDFPDVKVIPAANCVNGVAGSGWSSTSTGMPAACRAGSNNFNGVLQPIPSTGGTAYLDFELPGDWDTAVKPYISIYYASGANSSGTVIWTVSTACTKQDGSVTDDPAWVAESAMGTQTMATTNRMWAQNAQLAGTLTNCIAGSTMYVKMVVSGTAASAINVSKAVITTPRLLTVQAN